MVYMPKKPVSCRPRKKHDLELLSIDGLSAGADAVREVATLEHVAELNPDCVTGCAGMTCTIDRAQRRGPS